MRRILEMHKIICMKNPEDIKDIKDMNPEDIKDPEDQDTMNTGRRNYSRVAGESEEGSSKTEDKTKKNDDAKHGKIRNYLGLGLAHNFLIY